MIELRTPQFPARSPRSTLFTILSVVLGLSLIAATTQIDWVSQVKNKPMRDFRDLGGKAAVSGAGTVSTAGTAVSGVSTAFRSTYKSGDILIVSDTWHASGCYLTSQPIGPANDGVHPVGSLVTLFGSCTTSLLHSGDTILTGVYGGDYSSASALQNTGKEWTVDQIIDSTHFTTAHVMYPQVGSGQNACTVIVYNNLGYVTCNTPHGKATGGTTTISGTGATALDGAYTVTNAPIGFVLDPTSATAFNITTSGVANGYYVTPAIALSGVSPTVPVSCAVSSNVATCTFLQWPGFTPGDAIRISGASSGTCTSLNGAGTISTIGTGDYPKTITFATSGVSDGTCADAAMLFGSSWSYKTHPQRRVVGTVTNDTAMTVTSGFSPDFPVSSTHQNTPDNSAAFLAACAAGVSVFMPDGDYHVNNTSYPTNRQCNNFSKEWRMSAGARWVLDDITWGGFWFQGGESPLLSNWRMDSLYTPPSSNNGLQPGIELRSINRPVIENFRANGGNGNVLSAEFNDHPIFNNVQMNNVAGGLLLNGNVAAAVTNFTVDNGRDETLAVYKAPNTCPSCVDEERGVILTNFHFRNTPNIQIATIGDVRISNGVIEGSHGPGITMNNQTPSTDASSKVQVSSVLIKGAGMAGPNTVWIGGTAAVQMSDQTWVSLDNVQIISTNPQSHIGGVLMWNAGILGTLQITGGSIASGPSYGVQFFSKRLEMHGVYLEELDDSCVVTQGTTLVMLSNLTCRNAAKLWGGGAGASYGANYALVFTSDAEFRVNGLNIIDSQATATGYKIYENGTTVAGTIIGATSNITDVGHPLAWTIGTPAKVAISRDLVGIGNPVINAGNVTVTNSSSSIGSTNVLASAPAGFYFLHGYMVAHTTNTGTVDVSTGWTDPVGAKTAALASGYSLASSSTVSSFGQRMEVAAGTNITYTTTHSGAGTYDLYMTLERIK